MSDIVEQAKLFFEACETGMGWDGCKAYCHPGATFSAQVGVLSDIDTLEGYSERWTPSFGQGFVTAKVESGSRFKLPRLLAFE